MHLSYHDYDSSSLVYISVYALVACYILAALDICSNCVVTLQHLIQFSRDKIIPYYREEEEYKPPEVWNTYREDIHKRS